MFPYCKKTDRRKVKSINYKTKNFFEKLSIDDRVGKMQENEAFITIKDHKEGFSHRVSCRLLSHSETNTGKISQQAIF